MPRLKRSSGFGGLALSMAVLVVLSSCSGDDDASSTTVVQIQPSSYNTQPQVLPSSTSADGSVVPGEPGSPAGQAQAYVVKRNDTLSGIASRYGVKMDEIVSFNDWTDGTGHSLQPGDEIKIPPNADIPQAVSTEGDSNTVDTAPLSGEPGKCPDGSPQGTYTVVAGDLPSRVANDLNVSVAALDDANANTSGYGAFIVGIKIVVPCPDDASAST